jgi:nucleoside-diphosphate-sugar epimerase
MILLTGGTGFVGSHVLERLRADGAPVRCLVRPKAGRTLDAASMGATEVVAGDLETGAGLQEALAGVETVIHLAGVTKALRPEEYYDGNVRATTNLLVAMAGSGARLVHVSSLAAIGPAESVDRPVDEETEPHPLSDYGKSKLEGEKLVRASRPDAVIVRPPVVYGPRDTDVFQILKPVAKGWSLQMSGGERWFSAIYVDDLAAGLVQLAASQAGAGGTYYMAHRAAGFLERAGGDCAARIMGVKLRVVKIPPPLALSGGALRGSVGADIADGPASSREKIAEGCAGLDLRHRRARGIGIRRRDGSGARARGDAPHGTKRLDG